MFVSTSLFVLKSATSLSRSLRWNLRNSTFTMSSEAPMVSSYEKGVFNPNETTHSDSLEALDHAAEKRLVRKIDWRLLPPLMILFLLAFIDRINIGNAKIQGMTKDLKMTGGDYGVALSLFFVP